MSLTEQQKAELFDFLAQNTVSLTLVGYDGRHSVVEQKSSRTPENLAASIERFRNHQNPGSGDWV